MASTRFNRTRAQIALLARWQPDDPRLPSLREQLPSALVVQRIAAVLDKSAVPLTPHLRAEIEQLLDERQIGAVA